METRHLRRKGQPSRFPEGKQRPRGEGTGLLSHWRSRTQNWVSRLCFLLLPNPGLPVLFAHARLGQYSGSHAIYVFSWITPLSLIFLFKSSQACCLPEGRCPLGRSGWPRAPGGAAVSPPALFLSFPEQTQ